jgi:serine/threonine-protein kinase
MEDLIGKIIDNYRIDSVLGRGGMGIVYRAYDTKLDRYVAIKMLLYQAHNKERFIERFKREAKNHAKLSHPNIVTVYGFIEYSNLLGIVMEYVEGESLEKVIDRQHRFNLYDVIYILKQLLLGMGYAHSKGFVHRDIKPSNIILNKEGITKIMDFGISKSLLDNDMTKTGSKMGTVYYMSPEQIRGEEVTNRSDIYSIGCTVYEMITGEPPFDSKSEYEVMDGHLKKTVPLVSEKMSGIPEQVDKILQKAMEKNPINRYNSCEQMYDDVQELDKLVAKLYSGYFEKVKPRSKKYKLFSVSAFVGFILVIIALSFFVFSQVSTLLKNDGLDKFRKYSIKSLFSPDESKYKFTSITKVQSGINKNINSINFAEDVFAAAVGDSGTIISSKDGGINWSKKNFNRPVSLSGIYCFPRGKSIIVGDSSSIYYSTNYLDTLIQIPMEPGHTFFNIKFLDNNIGFITGNKGLILKTTNGGLNWSRMITNTKENIYDIAFFNSHKGFAVGWNGLLLETNNGGDTWQSSNSQLPDNYLKSIDVKSSGYGLIVGEDGIILYTSNSGDTWDKIDMKTSDGFRKVKYISDEYAIIIGSRGVILVSKDKGKSWKVADSIISSNMNGLAVSPYDKIFIVGVYGMIYKIE